MIAEVIDKDGQGTLGFRVLSGASSGGLPLGTIIAVHSSTVPAGYLPCNGMEFNISLYPALYTLLHDNHTPDLRECNLVGTGASTRVISAHDIYTLGQFKDDQIQTLTANIDTSNVEISVNDPGHTHTVTDPGHTHNVDGDTFYGTSENMVTGSVGSHVSNVLTSSSTTGVTVDTATTGITASIDSGSITATLNGYRSGATTHGKNYGVNYIIKATTGMVDVSDAEIYAQVVALLQADYAEIDKSALIDGDLIKYDAAHNKFVNVERPTLSNQVLTSNVTGGIVQNLRYWTFNDTVYTDDLTPVTPEGTETSRDLIGNVYFSTSANSYFVQDNGDWYYLGGFSTTSPYGFITGAQETDPDIIAELIDPIPAYTVVYTYTSDITYEYTWTTNSSKGLAFIGTTAAYNVAKLIPEGQTGFIPSGSAIVLTDVDNLIQCK